jgi:hypothetical protein
MSSTRRRGGGARLDDVAAEGKAVDDHGAESRVGEGLVQPAIACSTLLALKRVAKA